MSGPRKILFMKIKKVIFILRADEMTVPLTVVPARRPTWCGRRHRWGPHPPPRTGPSFRCTLTGGKASEWRDRDSQRPREKFPKRGFDDLGERWGYRGEEVYPGHRRGGEHRGQKKTLQGRKSIIQGPVSESSRGWKMAGESCGLRICTFKSKWIGSGRLRYF